MLIQRAHHSYQLPTGRDRELYPEMGNHSQYGGNGQHHGLRRSCPFRRACHQICQYPGWRNDLRHERQFRPEILLPQLQRAIPACRGLALRRDGQRAECPRPGRLHEPERQDHQMGKGLPCRPDRPPERMGFHPAEQPENKDDHRPAPPMGTGHVALRLQAGGGDLHPDREPELAGGRPAHPERRDPERRRVPRRSSPCRTSTSSSSAATRTPSPRP